MVSREGAGRRKHTAHSSRTGRLHFTQWFLNRRGPQHSATIVMSATLPHDDNSGARTPRALDALRALSRRNSPPHPPERSEVPTVRLDGVQAMRSGYGRQSIQLPGKRAELGFPGWIASSAAWLAEASISIRSSGTNASGPHAPTLERVPRWTKASSRSRCRSGELGLDGGTKYRAAGGITECKKPHRSGLLVTTPHVGRKTSRRHQHGRLSVRVPHGGLGRTPLPLELQL